MTLLSLVCHGVVTHSSPLPLSFLHFSNQVEVLRNDILYNLLLAIFKTIISFFLLQSHSVL
uniref:Uncharacterized protein n=1 Tax=Arundo donax TaxID=35708 RepID=A0A0A9GYD0_ARUDO